VVPQPEFNAGPKKNRAKCYIANEAQRRPAKIEPHRLGWPVTVGYTETVPPLDRLVASCARTFPKLPFLTDRVDGLPGCSNERLSNPPSGSEARAFLSSGEKCRQEAVKVLKRQMPLVV